MFPKIIEVVLKYSSTNKMEYMNYVNNINDTLFELVLGTMINKTEFQNIFGELKKQFKETKTVRFDLLTLSQAKTKEIVITWFAELFKAFQEELIDKQTDVFDELINSLDFSEQVVWI